MKKVFNFIYNILPFMPKQFNGNIKRPSKKGTKKGSKKSKKSSRRY